MDSDSVVLVSRVWTGQGHDTMTLVSVSKTLNQGVFIGACNGRDSLCWIGVVWLPTELSKMEEWSKSLVMNRDNNVVNCLDLATKTCGLYENLRTQKDKLTAAEIQFPLIEMLSERDWFTFFRVYFSLP